MLLALYGKFVAISRTACARRPQSKRMGGFVGHPDLARAALPRRDFSIA
jgi:hypothetical protein